MILCVRLDVLKKDKEKLDRDNFMRVFQEDNLKYFKESEIPNDYRPVNFMTTIRGAYSNKVVVHNTERQGEEIQVPYINVKNIDVTVHTGTDLLMFLSSVTVMNTIKYVTNKIDEVMMQSQFVPMGIYYAYDMIDPIIYSQVVLKDDTLETFSSMFREGYEFIDIKHLECRESVLKPIYDTIVEVEPSND